MDLSAVRSMATWEYIAYHTVDWVNAGICLGDSVGTLGQPSVYCQEFSGTTSACEAECSSISDCMGFIRAALTDDQSGPCQLLADVTNTADFPQMTQEGSVTHLKQHTILHAGVWTKTEGQVGHKSKWMHASGCYELEFENDGFEIDIKCRDLDLADPPPFGAYKLDFKSHIYRCEPFEGLGDYIRYAFTTPVIRPRVAHHVVIPVSPVIFSQLTQQTVD